MRADRLGRGRLEPAETLPAFLKRLRPRRRPTMFRLIFWRISTHEANCTRPPRTSVGRSHHCRAGGRHPPHRTRRRLRHRRPSRSGRRSRRWLRTSGGSTASHSAANFSVRHNVVSTVRGQLGADQRHRSSTTARTSIPSRRTWPSTWRRSTRRTSGATTTCAAPTSSTWRITRR